MHLEKDHLTWVLPASIPFETIKGHDLEECVYWLMDSMGAKDLEWRVGGSGGGSADGGRDLEARFFSPSPDGEMEAERWWIECKGRSGTLEPDAVKSACNNALAEPDLSYLVIATNTTFSNPTRDWVKAWQVRHPRPKVKLWDQSSLERMLSRHPSAVSRLFSYALSTAGCLEVAREGFWNRFEYAAPKALERFWAQRDDLTIGPLERTALVISEFANGRIADRSWGVAGGPVEAANTLGLAIANLSYLLGRALRSGIEQRPVMRGIAYLILASLQFYSAEIVAELIDGQLTDGEGNGLPNDIRRLLFSPIVNTLVHEMQEVCTSDCSRFILGRGDALAFDNETAQSYWSRLDPNGHQPEVKEVGPSLWIQKNDEPCKIGFSVGPGHGCPLFEEDPDDSQLEILLAVVERIADFRLAEMQQNSDAS